MCQVIVGIIILWFIISYLSNTGASKPPTRTAEPKLPEDTADETHVIRRQETPKPYEQSIYRRQSELDTVKKPSIEDKQHEPRPAYTDRQSTIVTGKDTEKLNGYIVSDAQALISTFYEIDLHGIPSIDSALYEMRSELRGAYDAGYTNIKVIHGKGLHGDGTGQLRSAVHRELKRMNYIVNDYHLAGYYDGGKGVTIVTLRGQM